MQHTGFRRSVRVRLSPPILLLAHFHIASPALNPLPYSRAAFRYILAGLETGGGAASFLSDTQSIAAADSFHEGDERDRLPAAETHDSEDGNGAGAGGIPTHELEALEPRWRGQVDAGCTQARLRHSAS